MGVSRDDSTLSREENIVAFIDTMIFLHFQPFDQIDWPTVLNASQVTLIIPPIIMRELNKHKDTHALRKIRERAQRVIGKLLELFKDGYQANVRRSVDVRYQAAEQELEFDAHKLDPKWGDDELLATVLSLKTKQPDINVVIVTDDPNLILKSRQYGIAALRLAKELKLPDVLDDYDKEIEGLERTILELKSRAPILRLGFDDGSDRVTFNLIKPSVTNEEEINQTVEQLKQQHPKLSIPPPAPADTSERKKGITKSELAELFKTIEGYTVQERQTYNAELDQFFSAYRSYLEKTAKYLDVQARTIVLDILVYNDGTTPGEDIDLHLHFPDGFRIVSSGANPPARPKAPKAQTTIERLHESLRMSHVSMAGLLPHGTGVAAPSHPPNVSGPRIRRTKSYDVDFRIRRLKHKTTIYLDRLFCVFDSFENTKSFGVKYEINAGNVPQEIQGMLHVIVEKELEP